MAAVRRMCRVHAQDMQPESAARLTKAAEEMGLDCATESTPEAVARAAEIIVTVTPSQKPILMRD